MMALASRRSQYLDGGYGIDCAQDTAAGIDRAVMELIRSSYDKAVQIIRDNREDMDKVVEYLLQKETITGEEMMAILEGRDPALADNFGASRDSSIEAPAKNIHMISQKIEAPEPPAEEPEAAPEGFPGSGESSEDPAP